MRKEVFFAIVAGVSIGLLIAFGAWKVVQTLKKNNIVDEIKKNIPPKNNISLTVSNLYSYDIVTENPFKLTGISKPQSDIVVSTNEDDFFTKTLDDGSFEIEIELPSGLSEIVINDQKIPVVFSTEFNKYIVTNDQSEVSDEKVSTDEAQTSDGAETIRERIKNEVSGKSLKKTAYIGTITDISSGTIQIKSVQGDIKQMSLTDETTYINTLKKNVEVKAADLAIGDYIVAMGFVNGNKVLDAKRILIGSPLVENKYKSIIGTVQSISKTKLVIDKGNDETIEMTLPKKWVGPDTTDIDEGQKIITVGEYKEETYTLRTIYTPVE